MLAARLSAEPAVSVALVEAGHEPADPDIADPLKWPTLAGRSYDWAFRTTPQAGTNGRVHDWPRGKLVGGSSAINAMAHVRGHPDDFSAWAEAGGERWSYAALLPTFRRSESFSGGASDAHGGDGPLPVMLPTDEVHPVAQAFMQAGAEIGAPRLGDHNLGPICGTAPNSLTIRDGLRVTAADAYLTPDVRRRIALFTGANVECIEMQGGRAQSVLLDDAGNVRRLSAPTIILCAGAVSSPLLLMRSGVGDAPVLRGAGVRCAVPLPGVGTNLHDHLFAAGLVYASRQPVPRSRLQHSESLMYLHSDDPARADGVPDCVVACVAAPVASERFAPPPYGSAYTLLFGITHPTSRGSIRIYGPGSADAPVINPAYLSTAHDRETFRRSLKLARRIGEAPALGSWRNSEALPGVDIQCDASIDAFVADAAITHHHPVGTCRMGADAGAVVDGDLKVHGLDNLFVVDASIIPSLTTGPVNAATIAIAEQWAGEVWPRLKA